MTLHQTTLSPQELDSLAADIDLIRKEITHSLGEADVKYIRRIFAATHYLAFAGRAILWLCWLPLSSWWLPSAVVVGGFLLGISKILSDMEIGHNIMHGQYDWTNDPQLQGATYEWDCICLGDNWRHTHNYLHHTYTNVLGMDHDIGYGVVRIRKDQPWHWIYLFQPFYAIPLAFFFQWGVALQTWRIEDWVIHRTKSLRQLLSELGPYLPKLLRQLFKDYIFFPLLSILPSFTFTYIPFVFIGNLIANGLRNLWIFVVIFCGHFPPEAELFDPKVVKNESKGHWYYRQIVGSCNFTGARLLHIMAGNLSLHLEHHLFPDLPSNRYSEIAPRIQAICKKYNLPYNIAPFPAQFAKVVWQMLKCSLPIGVIGHFRANREMGTKPTN
jgi:hypothetical protein